MKRFFSVLIILSICAIHAADGQTIVEGHGDLYVIHLPEGGVRVVAMAADGTVRDTTFTKIPDDLTLRYVAEDDDTDVDFCFTLHKPIPVPTDGPLPEKTLVVSDLHGRLDAFVALLRGNGVMDGHFDWQYGANRLIFVGDILDRGRDDNGIAWLLYKLQQQAAEAGGRVDLLPGNHEDLVMKNDLRYVHKAHLAFAERVGIPYTELYGAQSELGRWFRTLPLIIKADGILFVHAGLSRTIADSLYTLDEMNARWARYGGMPNRERNLADDRNELLFGGTGALWYRGLVQDAVKYSPASSDDLDTVLDYYGAALMIIGHSEIEEVEERYDGRVIAVNVDHDENYEENRTAALLIENGEFFAVGYDGRRRHIPLLRAAGTGGGAGCLATEQ